MLTVLEHVLKRTFIHLFNITQDTSSHIFWPHQYHSHRTRRVEPPMFVNI